MQFLIDKSPRDVTRKAVSSLVAGQLLTPLTRYADWGGEYAIDNGAFSGFRAADFSRLLERQSPHRARCLFVTCPDIVGNARRTLELWQRRDNWLEGWPSALVAQDGLEEMPVPWDDVDTLFVGGGDPWKDSAAAADLVRTAKTLGVWVHVGRVNTPNRFEHFDRLGADTCDGSGVAMYDHMLAKIERRMDGEEAPTLFPDPSA